MLSAFILLLTAIYGVALRTQVSLPKSVTRSTQHAR